MDGNRTSRAQDIIDRFRSRATGLRRRRDQAFADIRRTLTSLGHAAGGDDEKQLLNDPTYAEWLTEAEMLEADADTIESLQAENEKMRKVIRDHISESVALIRDGDMS